MGISYVEYLANPKYRKDPFDGLFGWILANRPPSVEDLQSKYEFRYYSTMNKAVTDVNNGATANADAEKGTAVAGVYTDENGGKNVVLLKDHIEAARIQPSADMTINLGGHGLSTDDVLAVKITAGNVTIDGRLRGSEISVTRDSGKTARAIQSNSSGVVIVNGGTYIARSTGGYNNSVACIYSGNNGVLNIFDATIETYAETAEADANDSIGIQLINGIAHISGCNVNVSNGVNGSLGILNRTDATATITNCDITATSSGGICYGVRNYGTATITNSDIQGLSNYTKDDDGDYGVISIGVENIGTVTLNNCNVMGTHSGVGNSGTLTVNGGTYEGYGHGGFYFAGAGTISYVRDAIIRDCDMPDGYTATANRNGAGFYLGDATNETVYMDNCDIYGTAASQIFVLKTNDNALYISNSTINNQNGGAANVRIDSGNTLYLGRGNNFTAENTSLPEAVVVTDEVYREVA